MGSGVLETGAAGAQLEADLVTTARSYGMRVVGPNCLGVLNTDPDVRLSASLAALPGRPGPVGMASQSGALGIATVADLDRRGVGVSQFVSLGNKADVQLLIDYMTDADAQAKGLAEAGRCNADGRAAVAIPAKYQGYAQPAQWSAALDRYCTFHNQGY